MHNHHLKDMVELLVKKKLIPADKSETALKVLSHYWEDKIAIVWQTEDVIERAKESHRRCTKERAKEVLASMLDGHDCNYGISWETIDAYLYR